MRSTVKIADERTIPVMGKGNILNKLNNGDHKYISDVLYMPDMTSNLLSVGQLLEKGYVIHLENKEFVIRNK